MLSLVQATHYGTLLHQTLELLLAKHGPVDPPRMHLPQRHDAAVLLLAESVYHLAPTAAMGLAVYLVTALDAREKDCPGLFRPRHPRSVLVVHRNPPSDETAGTHCAVDLRHDHLVADGGWQGGAHAFEGLWEVHTTSALSQSLRQVSMSAAALVAHWHAHTTCPLYLTEERHATFRSTLEYSR